MVLSVGCMEYDCVTVRGESYREVYTTEKFTLSGFLFYLLQKKERRAADDGATVYCLCENKQIKSIEHNGRGYERLGFITPLRC